MLRSHPWLLVTLLIPTLFACRLLDGTAGQPTSPSSPPSPENPPTQTLASPAIDLSTPAALPPPAAFDPANPDHLRRAAQYSADNKGISFLVMQNGQILAEDYPIPGAADYAAGLASGTKSFSCAIAVAAIQDGLLTSFDEKVADTVTEWQSDPQKSQITLRQLLSLTSGLEPGEYASEPTYAEAIQFPLVDPPGEKFNYGPIPFQAFGEIIVRKLAPTGQDPLDYLKARVFAPIGLKNERWRHTWDRNPILPSGAFLTARDWAKYGELVRLRGEWQGEKILSGKLLDECFQGTSANPAYGLTWWLKRDVPSDLHTTIPQLNIGTDLLNQPNNLPDDLVMAAGAGMQRLYIIPSLNLVVVRQATGTSETLQGNPSAFSDLTFLNLLLTGQP